MFSMYIFPQLLIHICVIIHNYHKNCDNSQPRPWFAVQVIQQCSEDTDSLTPAISSSTQLYVTVQCLELFPLGRLFHYHCFTRLPLGKAVMQPASSVGLWPHTELYICQPSSGFVLLHLQATYVCTNVLLYDLI